MGDPVLVHDPIGLRPLGRLPTVEHQSLLDRHRPGRADRLVGAGGLPVARAGGAVRA